MPEEKIKIILTSYFRIERNGVRRNLEKNPDIEIIGEADNGMELLKMLDYLTPNTIIMDTQMPIMDGATTMTIIRKKYPDLKVIVFSLCNDYEVICKMIGLGANAYLIKDASTEQIYEAIFACQKERLFLNDTVAKAVLMLLKPIDERFTEREIEILKKIQTATSIKEIADQVDLSSRTVEAILNKLKTKAGVESFTALMEFAKKF